MRHKNFKFSRRQMLGLGSAMAAYAAVPKAWAQSDYPSRSIRLVVPAAAGGATDIIGRLVAQKVSENWPAGMIVDNKPGGGGTIGTADVARAKGDGYTLLLGAINHTINPALVKNMPYDSVKEFTFISHLLSIPNVLIVKKSLDINTVAEFIEYCKENPGKLVFASSGNGTSQHLAGEMFMMETGVKYLHVPYKGAAPAMNDLLGGHVDFMFDNLPAAAQQIRAGTVRALGVTSEKRSPAFPDLPAISETVPGFDVRSWFGLMGPAGMSSEVVQKLHEQMVTVFSDPALQERVASLGGVPDVTDPQSFNAYVMQEMDRWAKVVEASGAKIE
ncbi:tripartite tricarboxylate transporter substrate binding protein [Alcaligenaceae bacterium]|nr:tripartite tricarboxylate transporter substrate binding protein [Alcaligenaceae bacterium]